MARPEPMNATPHHPKAKVSLYFSDPLFVAGEFVTGKMEFECRAEKGLGVSAINVELFAIQELTSRDHSATNTFLHLTRYFQGPSLPPSNAVHPHPLPECDPLPADHYQARKGVTTFFFRFPLPRSSPASIDYGQGLAKLKYEVRASASVSWRTERQLVMERREVTVVEAPIDPSDTRDAEQVVVGENGKIWVQGRILNPYVVAGHNACLELFVKNHSTKRTSSLNLSLARHLHLPAIAHTSKTLQLSDTLQDVAFSGSDYIVLPGTEGIANLVLSVPKNAQGVRSGRLDTGAENDDEIHELESLFDVQCIMKVKLGLGIGNEDIILELPITIVHPLALRTRSFSPKERSVLSPMPYPPTVSLPQHFLSTCPLQQPDEMFIPDYISPPTSPLAHFVHPWSPSPSLPLIQPVYDQYYCYPPPTAVRYIHLVRPSSADPFVARQLPALPTQTQVFSEMPHKGHPVTNQHRQDTFASEDEPGKGERASRISAHLRMSSRNRSVSPQSHRFHQASSSVVTALNDSFATPQIDRSLMPMAGPAKYANNVPSSGFFGASRNTSTKVLAPRPVLSHKQSFTVDRGTVTSERVADLERMAAETVADKEDIDARNKSLPRSPSFSDDETPDTPRLPPEPTLAPIATHLRSGIRGRVGGLEALERKLLEQVGTRRPQHERRVDVRSVLPGPIKIPSPNDPRCDPPNDSAISSLALGADGPFGNSLSPPSSGLHYKPPPSSPPSSILDEKNSGEKEHRGSAKGREKRSEAHQLRKAATGRVAAWLGGLDPAVQLPASETLATSSPKTPVKDIPSAIGINPRPLLRSPPIQSPVPIPDIRPDGTIPTRSSGFILHDAKDTTSTFEQPKRDHVNGLNATTPTQPNALPNSPPSTLTPSKCHSPPMKPVLRRFADLVSKPQSSGVKYDVRSARGGRGGKVTSVATLWASLASQQEHPSSPAQSHKKAEPFRPDFEGPQSPVPSEQTTAPSKSHLHSRTPHKLANTSVADSTSRHARMVKSTSVPAVVSSSLATPILSSTASLALPLQVPYPKHPYPQTDATASITSVPLSVTPSARFPSSTSGNLAFGQARLKDLIKKYQGSEQ